MMGLGGIYSLMVVVLVGVVDLLAALTIVAFGIVIPVVLEIVKLLWVFMPFVVPSLVVLAFPRC